jgi:MYXO-CTERM domain-containing protein
VLIAGGEDSAGKLKSIELFDPQTVSWSPGPPLSAPRRGHAAARLMDGSVLIVGGESAAVELFSAAPDRLLSLPGLGATRSDHTLTAVSGNKAVLVGGLGSGGAAKHFDAVHVFDGATRTWDTIDSTLNTARRGHLATLLATGRILISGGRDQSSALASLELSKPYGAPRPPGDAGARDGDGDLGAADGGDSSATGEGCSFAAGPDGGVVGLLYALLLLLLFGLTRGRPRRCGGPPPSAGGWWRS